MKKRSAISKSMPKKSQGESKHVSGLSSSKAPSKRKEGPVKFGSLSRKQRQSLMDYGELVPRDFEHDKDDSDDNNDQGATKMKRRVIVEADLDREINDAKQNPFPQLDSDSDSDSQTNEEDWGRPSAYSVLLGSLKKTSKNQDLYKKIQREQEGLDSLGEESEDGGGEDEEGEDEEDEDVEGSYDNDMISKEGDSDDEMRSAQEEGEDTTEDNDKEEEIEYASSDEEESSTRDLFETRYADQQPKDFDEKITLVEQKKWSSQSYEEDHLGNVLCYTAGPDKTIKQFTRIGNLDQVGVREKVAKQWTKANSSSAQGKLFTPLQEHLFSHISQYRDVMYCDRSFENAKEIRRMYALHAMNHIAKGRHRIQKNNTKIAKALKEDKEPVECRDQGFARPRVLIVLPFRNTVVDVVESLIELSGAEQHENKKRFYSEFNLLESDAIDESKPADFRDTFHDNIDDHFQLAIKFHKKSIKFYSDFYSADIIIASPLGLRTIIGTESDTKRNFDFLSSLEMVILDQTNHFLMQNWEHVEHLFEHINLIPTDAHGCDISRIKSWYLDGKARYLRQTIIISDFLSPEMNALFGKHLKNVSGKLKIKPSYDGTILNVVPSVQQTFTRIDSPSLAAVNDSRFKFFVEKTLPSLRKSTITQSHTLIFIPSYFDFVRVRNYLEDNKYSYEPCCEYTSASDVGRARTQFFHGRTNFILYTERIHFFRRYNIRGTFHAVFYGLPDHPQFYTEVVNFLGLKFNDATAAEEATFSCSALFSKYDFLKLERIVGTDRAKKMCGAQKNIFTLA